jgi:ubiquinone/menaquinone biosynthesis C-methylase UbiE
VSWFEDAFGPWYRIVYPHRDGAEARRLVESLQARFALDGVRTLDIGCGSGRHLEHFEKLGARVVGVDLSPSLLAEARGVRRELGARFALVRADMRALPFAPGSFGGVTSLFTSFGYFPRTEEDRRALAEASRVLARGGFHVLDFLNRATVLAHPSPQSERVSGPYRILEKRAFEEGGRRIVKKVTILPREGVEPLVEYEERVNLYSPDELRSLLGRVGLVVREEWGGYDGSPFDPARSSRHLLLSVKEMG